MTRATRLLGLACWLTLTAAGARTVDDFSGDGWTRFNSTPGTMTAAPGRLHLVDAAEEPDWVTASKVFTVDVDATPWFLVMVTELSERGTVKLIRRQPYDKRDAIQIDRPGLYALNLRERFRWEGPAEIETCLYAIGPESEITYGYVAYAAALTPEDERLLAERMNASNTRLVVEPFELVPLFNACGVYFKSEERPAVGIRYREVGGDWRPVLPPAWVPEDGMYRGSVIGLSEDTAYELQITDGEGLTLASGEFRTWSSDPPIAKTIVLDETNFDGHLMIREQGTPDGWIKYTAKPGFVLRNDRTRPLLELLRAKYVILEGLTLRGGLKDAVTIRQCEHVRVINCDIAGWGRPGVQRFDLNGMFYTETGSAINWDTAILVSRSLGTVIERCYIHDPLTTANSWYYDHPAGPQAVGIDKPQSTVLRYNDFIGSDEHRWNDAVEGAGNFHQDGGFNRDADIYGNFMCYANDDAIEIDGGQINVRVFDNKFEGCLCGVSIQGCMAGPSYVFRNLIVNMGDERGLAGQSIKTSSNEAGPSAVSFIYHNTTFGESSDLGLLKILRIVAKNNIFAGRSGIRNRSGSPQSECDYNLQLNAPAGEEPNGLVGDPGFIDPAAGHYGLRADSPARGRGMRLDGLTDPDSPVDLGALPFGTDRQLPERPIPVTVDRPQLTFGTTGQELSVTARVGGEGFVSPYRIAQNDAFDWFTVTPSEGILRSGEAVTFRVVLDRAAMTARRHYRGAFLVRLADGYSRPVSVLAETGYEQAVKPASEGTWAEFIEAETPSGGKRYEVIDDPSASGGRAITLAGPEGQDPAEYRFTVPRAGKYFVVVRLRSDEPVGSHDSITFAVNDGPMDRAQLRGSTTWKWCLAAQNRSMSLICLQSFDLTAGEHVVKLAPRESIQIDLVALTDNPKIFE